MLAFNVAELLTSPVGTTLDLTIEDPRPDLGPELILAAPISGQIRLHQTQLGVLAQGQASTSVQLECARCLEPDIQGLQIKFVEEFRVAAPGEEIEADAFAIDEHHVIDLAEPLRQYFSLALPLAPLCREDCAGLCPDCGEPLTDDHQCALADAQLGGPFAALARLRQQG